MERNNFDWVEFFAWLIVCSIAMFLIACLTGCKTIEYVEVEKTKIEKEYIDRLEVDTIITRDSVVIEKKGDCEEIEKIKYTYKYKYIHDTCNIMKMDSVPYMVEVEKKLSRREQFYLDFGRKVFPFFLLLVVLIILYFGYKFYKKS